MLLYKRLYAIGGLYIDAGGSIGLFNQLPPEDLFYVLFLKPFALARGCRQRCHYNPETDGYQHGIDVA